MIIHTLIAWIVAVGIVLVSIFPYRPDTLLNWCLLCLLALPLVLCLELFGTRALNNSWMASRGRALRLAIGFVVLSGISISSIFAWQLLRPGFGTW